MKYPSQLLSKTLTGGALVFTAVQTIYATEPQTSVASKPGAGLLNDFLRQKNADFTNWDIGGAARLRYEIHEGFGIAGSPGSADFRDHGADISNDYLLSRIRFHTGYSKNWFGVYAEGRSSLESNDDRFSSTAPVPKRGQGPESDSIDLHQAYFTLGNLKEFPIALKVGRQELAFGEERLVGPVGWSNIGRVFDAAMLRWKSDWASADIFTSRTVIPEDGRLNVENEYDYFSGFYATTPLLPKNTVDFYFLARNSSAEAAFAEPSPQTPQPSRRDIYTIGTRVKSLPGQFGNWDYSFEAAGQFGNFRDSRAGAPAARLDHKAFAVIAQAGYTFTNLWAKPRLGLEYDFASGDSDPQDGKHETFENLFPTNHKFYGYMDFFSLQNLHDVRGVLQLKPTSKLNVSLEGHSFWLVDTHDSFYNVGGAARGGTGPTAGTGYGVNPNYSQFVGTELDLVGSYTVTKFAQIEAGYGHFFHGDYISQSLSAPTHGSRDADFCYVQLTVLF
jgi:hypothetical protein